MKLRTFAVLAGLLIALAGTILALFGTSVTAQSIYGTRGPVAVDCGAVWTGPTTATSGVSAVEVQTKCGDALGARATWVYVLLGVGALTMIGAAVVKPAAGRQAPQVAASRPSTSQ